MYQLSSDNDSSKNPLKGDIRMPDQLNQIKEETSPNQIKEQTTEFGKLSKEAQMDLLLATLREKNVIKHKSSVVNMRENLNR